MMWYTYIQDNCMLQSSLTLKMWSYEQFLAEGAELAARSQRLLSQWTRGGCKGEGAVEWQWRHGKRPHLPGNSYVVSVGNARTYKPRDCSGEASGQRGGVDAVDDVNALLEEDNDEMMDPVSLVHNCTAKGEEEEETVLFDFHIVFHAVYQAPVLYFRVTRLDGSPVSFYNSAMAQDLQLPGSGGRMPLVSMEDHQVLGTPFYFLHPCETASAMALLLDQPAVTNAAASTSTSPTRGVGTIERSKSPMYLLAWLSLVQPLTRIDPQMY